MRIVVFFTVGLASVAPALGWGSHGHRMVTMLALEALPADAPAWLRSDDTKTRAAYQANDVDRWRGWRSAPLSHINEPNHYLDIELLEPFGLTLETLPALRGDYLKAMILAKAAHPERFEPYDVEKDPTRTKEWPGFVLYAARENYAELQASFHQVRILENLNDPSRSATLEQARANVIYHIGALSHFVGDMAQPLHTTKHHHGWVGDNPKGYTTATSFHSMIDSGALDRLRIEIEDVRPALHADRRLNAEEPWPDLVAHLKRSYEKVEPLYALEHDGKLIGPEGRAMICERLGDGASTLSALIWAAYQSSAPTPKQQEMWVFYDSHNPELLDAASQPASVPAITPTETKPN